MLHNNRAFQKDPLRLALYSTPYPCLALQYPLPLLSTIVPFTLTQHYSTPYPLRLALQYPLPLLFVTRIFLKYDNKRRVPLGLYPAHLLAVKPHLTLYRWSASHTTTLSVSAYSTPHLQQQHPKLRHTQHLHKQHQQQHSCSICIHRTFTNSNIVCCNILPQQHPSQPWHSQQQHLEL